MKHLARIRIGWEAGAGSAELDHASTARALASVRAGDTITVTLE